MDVKGQFPVGKKNKSRKVMYSLGTIVGHC